jgi:thioredoxin-like negative regulator of GroEL
MNQSTPSGKINGVIVMADPENISPYVSSDKKTVVLFEMTGCPFCRIFQSAFNDFTEKRSEDCALLRVKLNDYDNPLWERYQIKAVPTVIVFAKGEIMARLDSELGVGLTPGQLDAFANCL